MEFSVGLQSPKCHHDEGAHRQSSRDDSAKRRSRREGVPKELPNDEEAQRHVHGFGIPIVGGIKARRILENEKRKYRLKDEDEERTGQDKRVPPPQSRRAKTKHEERLENESG